MDEDAIAAGFSILPVALVDISVGVVELALAVGLIVEPASLVLGSIWPNLQSIAFLHATSPVAFVNYSVAKSHFFLSCVTSRTAFLKSY